MARYDFLIETYRTERLKILSSWSQVPDARMEWRPEPRARSPHEQMVHQCVSEQAFMQNMLGIAITSPVLPAVENRLGFMRHYAAASAERLSALEQKSEEWFEEDATFFDVRRSRAWILTRRVLHSAHHRAQLTTYIRFWGVPLYSTYGPTADTGGLPVNGAKVVYRYRSVEQLLAAESAGGEATPPLPGPGEKSPTERPAQ